ncbi:MAG: TonB-dependent receptor [Bryobacterales bacterium]|nr:TonB-dependent receptor [Bryobacterales bacterium]
MNRCLLPLICLILAVPAFPQGATLIGRVTDPSGAVLAGAQITATQEATQSTTTTTTSTEGYFALASLPVGRYTVMVELKGFSTEKRSGLLLQVGQTVRSDFELKLGEVTTSVDVSGQLPVVQSETSSVGAVVETRQILGVPLNGRSLFSLLALAPGVQGAGTNTSIGGGPRNQFNNFTVDGTTNNDVISGRLEGAFPSLDTVAEFEVINANGSADNGRGGAQIKVVTKSGTNQFHGSLYEYNRNREFAARNFFAATNPPFNRNEFGGSIGGPLMLPKYNGRNRTFFFFSYEGLRERSPRVNTMTVPTAAQREGDFSSLAAPIIDPLAGGTPFPNGRIPANRITETSKALLDFLPLPNRTGGFNFQTALSNKPTLNNWSLRIDHTLTDRDRIYGRYFSFTNGPYFSAGPATERFGNGLFGFLDRNANFTYLRNMRPNLTNEFKFGYIFNDNFRNTANPDLDLSRLIPGLPPISSGAGGVPSIDILGFTTITENTGTFSGGFFRQWSHQYIDNVTWVKGKHIVKGGFDMNFAKSYDGLAIRPYPRGFFTFRGNFTRNALADFLLGWPLTAQRSSAFNGSTQPGASVLGYYIQDDWKITPKLTLNFGLRYEIVTRWAERDGQYANFDLKTNRIVVPNFNGGVSPLAIQRLLGVFPVVTHDAAGFPYKLIRGDHNNFSPRFGFAYRLTNKTVLRGGYGIYFGSLFGAQVLAADKNPPFVLTETTESQSNTNPTLSFANAFPTAGNIPANPAFTAFDPDLKNGYSQQANLTVERELPGSIGVRLTLLRNRYLQTWRGYDINQPRSFRAGPVQPQRPIQPWSTITYYDSGGSWTSNSLQIGAIKRYSHGLLFQMEYQFVRSIGDELYGGPQDIRNFRADRADLNGLARHTLRINYLYDLPFGKGKPFLNTGGLANYLIGGWQIAGITSALGGTPFSVNFNSTILGSPSGRADLTGNAKLDNPSIQRWFNPAAFAVPAPFTFGNSGRNILLGPGAVTFDFSLYKNFTFAEKVNLQFRSEFFNLFNKANFGNPASNISVPATVGIIASAAPARVIQFGLRLTF